MASENIELFYLGQVLALELLNSGSVNLILS